MGRNNRFVFPDTVRLPLSDGDWVEVKRELNVGDQKRLEAVGLMPPIMVNGEIISPIDWAVYEIGRAEIFVQDWSFLNGEGEKVKLSHDTFRALDNETFDEINKAILKHVSGTSAAKKAAREAKPEEKPKTPAEPTSDQTSQS